MKKVLCAVLLVAAVGFTGCEENPTTPNMPAATNYFPLTQNSSWTYEVTGISFEDEGTEVTTETKTVSGDTTVNGRKYVRIVSSDTSSTNEFIRRSNDTIFTLMEDGSDGIMAIERKGASWTKVSVEDGINSSFTYTVVDKGISRTVEGKTYNDVLHIRAIGTVGDEASEIEANGYLAKGVGPIEEETPFAVAKLKSYTIK